MRRTKTKPTVLPLGSVSTATLVPTDLLDAFLDVAGSVRMMRRHRSVVQGIARRYEKLTNQDTDLDQDTLDALSDDVATLDDILGHYAPDYCYFGAHEGDGADFGVWVDWTSIDHAKHDDEIAKSRDAANVEPKANFWIDVNDHGNATLYRRIGRRDLWRECWSVV